MCSSDLEMAEKKYFDLTNEQNDLSNLSVEKYSWQNCQLKDDNGVVYDGFKLAKSVKGNNFTICDIDFHKSDNDQKYQARLIFRKTDTDLQDKKARSNVDHIRISFKTGQDGYREFWKMIAFLNDWRKIIDLGEFDNYFTVTDKSLGKAFSEISNKENRTTALNILQNLPKEDLSNIDNIISIAKFKNVLTEWEIGRAHV